MADLPDTIRNPEAFENSKPAGFDGVFDWNWTKGCFGNTKISPMDFDGVVERNCHYLVFETKKLGIDIPDGQKMTLERLREGKSFTVMKIWGKEKPETVEVVFPDGKIRKYKGIEKATAIVKKWFKAADNDSILDHLTTKLANEGWDKS